MSTGPPSGEHSGQAEAVAGNPPSATFTHSTSSLIATVVLPSQSPTQTIGVGVALPSGDGVAVSAGVGIAVLSGVGVGVSVGIGVTVGVARAVRVRVAVGVA